MRYRLSPIFCRPWLLNGITPRLIESHYENNYGGALNRLNAITEKLESLDFSSTPGYVINWTQARGADRAQFHPPARALLRKPRRRRKEADRIACRGARP